MDGMPLKGDDMACLSEDQAIQMDKSVDNPGETALLSQFVWHFIDADNHH
jgi:hypothetical protein